MLAVAESPVAPTVNDTVVSRSDRLPPEPPYSGRVAVTVTSVSPSSSPTTAGETVNTTPWAHASARRAPEGNPTSSTSERSKAGTGPVSKLPQKPNRDKEPPAVADKLTRAAGKGPVSKLPETKSVSNLVKEPKEVGREPVSKLSETKSVSNLVKEPKEVGREPVSRLPDRSK